MNLDKAKRIHRIVDEIEKNASDIEVFQNAINNGVSLFQVEGRAENSRYCSTIYTNGRVDLLLEVLRKRNCELLEELKGIKYENDICKVTNLPCCYCQPVCNSREDK